MASLREELHPKLLLTWPVWGTLMALGVGTLLSATQLDWYPLADACVVFLGIYGLAKVCELALLAASRPREPCHPCRRGRRQ